jgi:hypothetical protein
MSDYLQCDGEMAEMTIILAIPQKRDNQLFVFCMFSNAMCILLTPDHEQNLI